LTWWHLLVFPVTQEVEVRGWLQEKARPYLKNKLKQKNDWGIAQVVNSGVLA
jgi:hypothetical protein